MFQELNSAIVSRSRREYNVFARGDTAGGREEGVGRAAELGSVVVTSVNFLQNNFFYFDFPDGLCLAARSCMIATRFQCY